MKRKGYLFSQITDIDNLRLAYCKAKRGKSAKADVMEFSQSLSAQLYKIMTELEDECYEFGKYHYFTIYDPKQRTICAADFAERVIHHAIMNVCAADFARYQCHHSYACQKGKGTLAAINRLKANTKKYQWYLKLDIRKYFDSIDHEILYSQIERIYKDKKLLNTFYKIIDSYHYSEGCGLPIGNLTSQYFANHYLSFADKYLLEELKIPAYVRYMDDMVLFSNDKQELIDKGKMFETYLQDKLHLRLKTFVLNKREHGLPALGFIYFKNRTLLNRRSKKRFVEKLTSLEHLRKHSLMSEDEFRTRATTLYAFINHADSAAFAKTMVLGIAGQARNDGNKSRTTVEGSNRVLRGGSWNNNARNVRVSNRNNNNPDNRNNNNGFRLALNPILKETKTDSILNRQLLLPFH